MVDEISHPNPLESEGNKSDEVQLEAPSYHWRFSLRSPSWQPPTDIYETEDAVVVRVEIAGMRDDNFSIELNGRFLTIRGVRQDVPERRAYQQMEIRFGEFLIDLELPYPVETDQIEASTPRVFCDCYYPKSSLAILRLRANQRIFKTPYARIPLEL